MKLIVEGPDSLGKTTLLDMLEEYHNIMLEPEISVQAELPISRRKMGLPEAKWTGQQWTDWSWKEDADLIDRCWLSEVLYGMLFRDGCNVTPAQADECWQRFKVKGYKMLLVVANLYVYNQCMVKRYDPTREAFTMEQCQRVAEAYYGVAMTGRFMHYKFWDVRDPSVKVRWTQNDKDFPTPGDLL